MTNRCKVCEEPVFMCSCKTLDKSFVGATVHEVYHRGTIIEGVDEPRKQLFAIFNYETIQGRK